MSADQHIQYYIKQYTEYERKRLAVELSEFDLKKLFAPVPLLSGDQVGTATTFAEMVDVLYYPEVGLELNASTPITKELLLSRMEFHMGVNATHLAKDVVRKTLVCFCSLFTQSSLTLNERRGFQQRIVRGLLVCFAGFNSELEACLNKLRLAKNMTELLAQYRLRVLDELRSKHSNGNVHHKERYLYIANKIGLAIPSHDVLDPYMFVGMDELQLKRLISSIARDIQVAFTRAFDPGLLVKRVMENSIDRLHLEGPRPVEYTAGHYSVVVAITEFIQQVLGVQSPNLEQGIKRYFICGYDVEGDVVSIKALNWPMLISDLACYLFAHHARLCLAYKYVFSHPTSEIQLYLNKNSHDNAAFKIGSGESQYVFFLGNVADFSDVLGPDWFQVVLGYDRLYQIQSISVVAKLIKQAPVDQVAQLAELVIKKIMSNHGFSLDLKFSLYVCLLNELDTLGFGHIQYYCTDEFSSLIKSNFSKKLIEHVLSPTVCAQLQPIATLLEGEAMIHYNLDLFRCLCQHNRLMSMVYKFYREKYSEFRQLFIWLEDDSGYSESKCLGFSAMLISYFTHSVEAKKLLCSLFTRHREDFIMLMSKRALSRKIKGAGRVLTPWHFLAKTESSYPFIHGVWFRDKGHFRSVFTSDMLKLEIKSSSDDAGLTVFHLFCQSDAGIQVIMQLESIYPGWGNAAEYSKLMLKPGICSDRRKRTAFNLLMTKPEGRVFIDKWIHTNFADFRAVLAASHLLEDTTEPGLKVFHCFASDQVSLRIFTNLSLFYSGYFNDKPNPMLSVLTLQRIIADNTVMVERGGIDLVRLMVAIPYGVTTIVDWLKNHLSTFAQAVPLSRLLTRYEYDGSVVPGTSFYYLWRYLPGRELFLSYFQRSHDLLATVISAYLKDVSGYHRDEFVSVILGILDHAPELFSQLLQYHQEICFGMLDSDVLLTGKKNTYQFASEFPMLVLMASLAGRQFLSDYFRVNYEHFRQFVTLERMKISCVDSHDFQSSWYGETVWYYLTLDAIGVSLLKDWHNSHYADFSAFMVREMLNSFINASGYIEGVNLKNKTPIFNLTRTVSGRELLLHWMHSHPADFAAAVDVMSFRRVCQVEDGHKTTGLHCLVGSVTGIELLNLYLRDQYQLFLKLMPPGVLKRAVVYPAGKKSALQRLVECDAGCQLLGRWFTRNATHFKAFIRKLGDEATHALVTGLLSHASGKALLLHWHNEHPDSLRRAAREGQFDVIAQMAAGQAQEPASQRRRGDAGQVPAQPPHPGVDRVLARAGAGGGGVKLQANGRPSKRAR